MSAWDSLPEGSRERAVWSHLHAFRAACLQAEHATTEVAFERHQGVARQHARQLAELAGVATQGELGRACIEGVTR